MPPGIAGACLAYVIRITGSGIGTVGFFYNPGIDDF